MQKQWCNNISWFFKKKKKAEKNIAKTLYYEGKSGP